MVIYLTFIKKEKNKDTKGKGKKMSEDEIKSCLVSSRIEKNFKLIRVIDKPDAQYKFDYAGKFGSEWIYYRIDRTALIVSGRKCDCEGNFLRYRCGKMRNPSPILWYNTCIESIPVAAFYHALKKVRGGEKGQKWKKFKITFVDISGNVFQKVHVKMY